MFFYHYQNNKILYKAIKNNITMITIMLYKNMYHKKIAKKLYLSEIFKK